MNKIKFAVVGCGQIGKRHADIIAQNQQAQLAALIDIKQPSQLNIQPYNAPFFSSLENFFQSNIETDVINIATPNGLHAQQAIECLNNAKHVVIEKPMALHTADAEEIIKAKTKYQKHVFVVMQNRYSPPVAWLKEIINKNILGNIYLVQLNCFWNRDERYYKGGWHGTKKMDGGVLFTQFSHFIDIFYWLFGDIKNIHTRLRSFNHKHLTEFEDSGIATFEFGQNNIGCLNFSTAVWDKNFESSITVIAKNGSIKIGGQYMDKVEYGHIKNYSRPQLQTSNKENDYGSYKGSAANHSYIIQNVIDVLLNKALPIASAQEGLKVVDIIERIYNEANIF
ncbi:MAG TPA: Gfo/Idh/MocA family oxidoreductase [Parafilimonas sp.]|jgi:predicted dehydrogenase